MYLSVDGTTAKVTGEVRVPNSKYHAHRALILASLAPGRSRVVGLSDAQHVRYTVQLLRGLGTRVEVDGDTFVVHGGPYRARQEVLSAGSSGSTLYFMAGLACLADRPVTVTGQKYFQRRPLVPLLSALEQMGVRLESARGCPPIAVQPRRPTGGRVRINGTLSQWISGLLLLAPFATGRTVIEVEGQANERTYLELTVRMMAQFGLRVDVSDDWRHFEVPPDQQAVPTDLQLPPDIGSAAFGLAAAAIHPSDVLLHGLTAVRSDQTDHPESDALDIMTRMGLVMSLDEAARAVRVRRDGSPLQSTRVDCRDLPDMLPVLSTMATFAEGTTVFDHVSHTRLKESDRASAMLQLNRMGGRLELDGDRLLVHGVGGLTGAALSSFNDHRVLMALAVAGSRASGRSTLSYPHAYRISYPAFLDAMNTLGIPMAVQPGRATAAPRRRLPATDVARTPITEWLHRWATSRPDERAVVEVGGPSARSWTWAELDREVDRLATVLLDLGVARGERVAFQLPNRAEFVALSLAILRVGAVCCPLMPILRGREVAFALQRSGARVLFVPDEFRGRDYRAETAAVCRGDGPQVEHVVVLGAAGSPAPVLLDDGPAWHDYTSLVERVVVDRARLRERAPSPDQTAQLLFTSGTSGEPKGVLHRHEVLTRAAAMQTAHLGLGRRDCVYIPSPLAHQTGFLYGMWVALVLGAPQVVQPVWDPEVAAAALREHGCTFVQAATPFLADLVRTVEQGAPAPEALRVFVATGAAVPRGLAERATRVLGAAVCGAWGTTETCLGTLSAPTDEAVKTWGTDGRALAGIEVRITDDEGRELPRGTEGNFELRGPSFFEGYLDHPDWTADAYTADGFFRTGDLGILDESGYIRISGRVKDIINRGGEKVPVSEIEQLLFEHPAVEDVAIVAMPDERLGERACAFVVLRPDTTLDFRSMQKHLDAHQVSKHYWPERLEVIDRLPRNATGKVQKFVLRDRARTLTPQPEEELPS
ncbi:MAG TPA: 3-phosphoshikimate 1-carboxyvinyltransferase [Segeticoccus sp.]|uniref:3-phosphoshikimate 1-carboxyvinyltransferase n=1 Tax=Segeticoccus sp. TaxID=2706531 RepID=UPI002D7E86F9|nr:3-phosphoshikimate 1-carboxyvinyltransferase [Segeticoccus sp.]HET8600229.1 3-phosphoshikimate 1-carboxyvinyltransferase [Segeticoccus sp.]